MMNDVGPNPTELRRVRRRRHLWLLLILPKTIVGGFLVIYSYIMLSSVLGQDLEITALGGTIEYTLPDCSIPTKLSASMEVGQPLIGRATLLSRFHFEAEAKNTPIVCNTPLQISIDKSQWLTVLAYYEYHPQTGDVAIVSPLPDGDACAPANDQRDCRSFLMTSRPAQTIEVDVGIGNALLWRTYTKSILSFMLSRSIDTTTLDLPATLEVNSTNLHGFRRSTKAGGTSQELVFAVVPGDHVTFYLEDLERAEQRDSRILIYGAVFGTGIALLAEMFASALADAIGARDSD